MRTFVATFLITGLFSLQALATDGSSGCGPGWYVFKENSLLSSALRSTTNGMLFPTMTIGMTVGTSNCTKHKIVTKEKESLHFATMNYYEIKGEMVRGQGEYLSAFAQTIGCPSQAQNRFNNKMKQEYETVYTKGAAQPEKVLLEVYKIILQDRELTAQCSLGVG
ncbi:MAG: DUF3015 family protein [Bdellovibrionales bacterium]